MVYRWSGFSMGSGIRKPNHVKSGQMATILSKAIWNLDKNVQISNVSRLWMVGYQISTVCWDRDRPCFLLQVVRGMDYLTSKKVMHGDLACRNILLASYNVIKICDFGLAKDMYKNSTYQKKTNSPLPIKWMAIESLRDRIFSTQVCLIKFEKHTFKTLTYFGWMLKLKSPIT